MEKQDRGLAFNVCTFYSWTPTGRWPPKARNVALPKGHLLLVNFLAISYPSSPISSPVASSLRELEVSLHSDPLTGWTRAPRFPKLSRPSPAPWVGSSTSW